MFDGRSAFEICPIGVSLRTPRGVGPVFPSTPLASGHVVILDVNESRRKIRATIAGLAKLRPSPP